jgi:sugar/nucleoside kinase (ribokinase family)
VRVVAAVGRDFPKKYLDGFRRCRADLAGLQVIPDGTTFRWEGTYLPDMNNRTTDSLSFGVLASFQPVVPASFQDSPTVFLACAIPAMQLRILSQMRGKPLVVCDTIEVYIRENRQDLDKVIRRSQGMIVNDSEARLLSGEDNLVATALGLLRKYRLEFLVLKKGEHGGILAYQNQAYPFPAYPLAKVADPTGAGDSFAGGLVATLDQAKKIDLKTLKKAILNATVVASFACEGVSLSRLSRVSLADCRERAKKFAQAVSLG